MKLRVPVFPLGTVAGFKDMNGGKLPATSSKRKKAEFVAEMEQAGAESDALNACVTELEACAMELEK